MLIVRTKLHETKNKGIGLFASENIKKDTKIWIFEDMFHKVITNDEYKNMNELQKQYVEMYATYCACGVDGYFLDLDNTRFINHSSYPNIEFTDKFGYATRDIFMREEILCDYGKLSIHPNEQFLGFDNRE